MNRVRPFHWSWTRKVMTSQDWYLSASSSAALDADLMSIHSFSIDQLMELAGLSVASASLHAFPNCRKPLIVCGPGNNGGDGLVAARHLAQFGTSPTVVYPSTPKCDLYERLLGQCRDMHIDILSSMPNIRDDGYDVVIDAMFGFGFKGTMRKPYDQFTLQMNASGLDCIAVDVPSGWDVDEGNVNGAGVAATVLISLSAPKFCSRHFTGRHYLGGRFLPPALLKKFNLTKLPTYPSSQQFTFLT